MHFPKAFANICKWMESTHLNSFIISIMIKFYTAVTLIEMNPLKGAYAHNTLPWCELERGAPSSRCFTFICWKVITC